MKAYIPAIVWLLVILMISGFPGNEMPSTKIKNLDKVVHFLMYFILSPCIFILLLKQYSKSINRLKLGLGVIVIGVLYGGFMEILQDYIFIKRSSDWYDLMADIIGTIFGVLFYPLLVKFLPINRWFEIK